MKVSELVRILSAFPNQDTAVVVLHECPSEVTGDPEVWEEDVTGARIQLDGGPIVIESW